MTNPLKAFVFDAYGTLFDVFSIASLCEDLFPDHGQQLANLWRKKQLEYSWLRSLMDRYRDFWAVTADALAYSAQTLNLELTASMQAQLMDSYLHLATFPDVKPGLQELRDRGMRLAILSNGEPKMLEAAVHNAGLDSLLERIISVDTVKVFKPSPRVYNRLRLDLSVGMQEIGFVSSNSWDINGAGSAGLRTFWLQRSGFDTPDQLGYPATHRVSTIADLCPLISDQSDA
jgi:2-haloacid dehalogenase